MSKLEACSGELGVPGGGVMSVFFGHAKKTIAVCAKSMQNTTNQHPSLPPHPLSLPPSPHHSPPQKSTPCARCACRSSSRCAGSQEKGVHVLGCTHRAETSVWAGVCACVWEFGCVWVCVRKRARTHTHTHPSATPLSDPTHQKLHRSHATPTKTTHTHTHTHTCI